MHTRFVSIARGVLSAATLGVAAYAVTPLVARTPVVEVAQQVADVPANTVAQVVSDVKSADTHFLGFDTSIYPGDDAMQGWRTGGAPYEWVGYYLTAPCHKDDSWTGKRATLSSMGYGFAVVYVGQQVWEPRRVTTRIAVRNARTRRIMRYRTVSTWDRGRGGDCSTSKLTSAQGAADASDAIAKTAQEGFAAGTAIFLDLERMDFVTPAMRAYYAAWTRIVLADGRFRPGYYVHTYNAVRVYGDVHDLYVEAGHSEDPPFWVAGSSHFSPESAPTAVGHAFANMWQGVLDTHETWAGVRLPIDVSVADARSPSASDAGL